MVNRPLFLVHDILYKYDEPKEDLSVYLVAEGSTAETAFALSEELRNHILSSADSFKNSYFTEISYGIFGSYTLALIYQVSLNVCFQLILFYRSTTTLLSDSRWEVSCQSLDAVALGHFTQYRLLEDTL